MSDSADSMIRVVIVFGRTSIFLTRPTTTAEEVPPSVAPMNKHDKVESPKINLQRSPATSQVERNPTVVIPTESRKESFTSDIFRSVPLSKRIKISTRLLNNEPNCPKDAGSATWKIRPQQNARQHQAQYVGIFRRLTNWLR